MQVPLLDLKLQYQPLRDQIRAEVEAKFQAPVAGVLPLSEDMVEMASSDIFSLRFPNHPWSQELRSAAKTILNLA